MHDFLFFTLKVYPCILVFYIFSYFFTKARKKKVLSVKNYYNIFIIYMSYDN